MLVTKYSLNIISIRVSKIFVHMTIHHQHNAMNIESSENVFTWVLCT